MTTSLRGFVVSLFLCLAPLAAGASSLWSPEQPVGDATLGAGFGRDASVAFNGDIYVVVWTRIDEVVATRIRSDGSLIDPFPFVVSEAPHPFSSPRVVWNGSSFLFIWKETSYKTSARFLRLDGSLSPAFTVVEKEFAWTLFAASNGVETLTVSNSALPRMVDAAGSVRTLPLVTQYISITSVASFDRGWVIVARDNRQISFERTAVFHVSADGSIEKTADLPGSREPQVFPTATGYLLFNGGRPLTATPLDARGRPAGEPIVVSEAVDDHAIVAATPLSDGSTLVVAQIRDKSLAPVQTIATRITGRDVAPPVTLGQLEAPLLAAGSPLPLLVWNAGSLRHGHIDPTTLQLVSDFATARAAKQQTSAASVAVDAGWFTVWRNGETEIGGAVVRPGGAASAEFEVAQPVARVGNPVVASNGDVVLVVWSSWSSWASPGELLARRFSTRGVPLDPEPFVIRNVFQVEVAVAWNGRYFLVVAPEGYEGELRLARVTASGILLDPEGKRVVGSERQTMQSLPAITVGNGTTLLVWQDGALDDACQITCPPPPPLPRVEGVRLTLEGDSIDARQIVFSGDHNGASPAVAADGYQFLVVWHDGPQIDGRLFHITEPWRTTAFSIPAEPLRYDRLAASPAPGGFFVAWSDTSAVRGALVDRNGALLDSMEFASTEPDGWADDWYSQSPALPAPFLAARHGELLLGYSRWQHQAGGVARLFVRKYAPPAPRRRTVRR